MIIDIDMKLELLEGLIGVTQATMKRANQWYDLLDSSVHNFNIDDPDLSRVTEVLDYGHGVSAVRFDHPNAIVFVVNNIGSAPPIRYGIGDAHQTVYLIQGDLTETITGDRLQCYQPYEIERGRDVAFYSEKFTRFVVIADQHL